MKCQMDRVDGVVVSARPCNPICQVSSRFIFVFNHCVFNFGKKLPELLAMIPIRE
jgi:hypothetical protein